MFLCSITDEPTTPRELDQIPASQAGVDACSDLRDVHCGTWKVNISKSVCISTGSASSETACAGDSCHMWHCDSAFCHNVSCPNCILMKVVRRHIVSTSLVYDMCAQILWLPCFPQLQVVGVLHLHVHQKALSNIISLVIVTLALL